MVLNKNESEIERLMREGQTAAKRGDKAMARVLLTQLLEVDPDNEQAWMWLSGVVTNPDEQTTCLENVLILNPDNSQARKGLNFIRGGAKPVGTKDLSGGNQKAQSDQAADATDAPSPFDLAAIGSAYQTSPIGAQPNADSTQVGAKPAPVTFAPSESSVNDLPGFLQVTPGQVTPGASASDGIASQAATAQQTPVQPSALDPFAPVDGVMPFQVPDDATYKGGPPTPGLPPDMGAAVPAWARGVVVSHDAAPPAGRQSGASQQDAGIGLAGGAMGAMGADALSTAPMQASTGPNPETDLNAWLEELTSSAKFNFEEQAHPDAATAHHDTPAAAPGAAPGTTHGMDPYAQQGPFPADPFNPGSFDFTQVGPYSGAQLPSPDDLPSDHGPDGQPWYLHSSQPSGYIGSPSEPGLQDSTQMGHGADGMVATATAAPTATAATATSTPFTLECPYCHHHVPDTSLACPECRYSFFVHCPHCHELVDTSLAHEGVIEPCPYCAVEINKWDLGLSNARGIIIPHAVPKESSQNWVGQVMSGPPLRRTLSFGWLVDVMWLIIIVLMIWALTQLPVWAHLTDLYN